MVLLAVSAHDIDLNGVAVDAALPVAWLDAELGDAGIHAPAPGSVQARLSRSGEEIVVRGRVQARLEIACARCLEPAGFDVKTELSLMLRPDPKLVHALHESPKGHETSKKKGRDSRAKDMEDEVEFSAVEAEHDVFDGETVVLDGFVREALLLEVPNFPLCSESCPGIAPAPSPRKSNGGGAIDPRLAPLGALLAKMGGASAPQPSPEPSRVKRTLTSNQTKPTPKKPVPKKKKKAKE